MNSNNAANNKKFNTLSLNDNYGNSYLFIRSGKGFFNIAKCEVLTDGHVDENDGLVPDAIPVHAEEVAYLVAESEERERSLERIESLLEEWIDERRSKSRRANRKQPRLQLQKRKQKQEAVI